MTVERIGVRAERFRIEQLLQVLTEIREFRWWRSSNSECTVWIFGCEFLLRAQICVLGLLLID